MGDTNYGDNPKMKDKAREEIERILDPLLCAIIAYELGGITAPIALCYVEDCLDQIFSLDCIQVKAEDQSLPKSQIPAITNYTIEYNEIYSKAQQDMLNDGWMRVEKKGDPK